MAGRLWRFLVLLAALGGTAFLLGNSRAEEPVYESPPPCEPGFQVVEEIRYKAVPCNKHVVAVQDTKKVTKAVYDVKCVDYAYKKCAFGYEFGCCSSCDGGGNPDCVKCGKPRTRKILLKKFVTEECPTTKCEVQYDYEQVPYTVYRKVPIGAVPGSPSGVRPELLGPPMEEKGKKPELLAPPKEKKEE